MISNDDAKESISLPTKRVKVDEIPEEEIKYWDVSNIKLVSPSFDPVKDAPYDKGWPIPFSLVAKSCSDIEATSGKDS